MANEKLKDEVFYCFTSIADQFRNQRIEWDLTQRDVAERVGKSQAWISKFEIGETMPRDVPTTEALLDAYQFKQQGRQEIYLQLFGIHVDEIKIRLATEFINNYLNDISASLEDSVSLLDEQQPELAKMILQDLLKGLEKEASTPNDLLNVIDRKKRSRAVKFPKNDRSTKREG